MAPPPQGGAIFFVFVCDGVDRQWKRSLDQRRNRNQITSATWDSYPILRFTDAPAVMVRVMDAPGETEVGAGEVSLGPVAGAIGNAVADAAGVRVRDMPLSGERVAEARD